jgi:hypothetical protein
MKEVDLERFYTEETLKIIAMQPHKLGWMLGYTKLRPIHSEWIRYIWDSDEPRALQAFRGGYKSTAIVVVGAIRWMLFHPNDRICIIRKNFRPALEISKTISQGMELPQIKELFAFAHGEYHKRMVSRGGSLTYSFKKTNTPEGSVTAMGLTTGITGNHFDKIICDDFVTLEDRISRAERRKTIELVREISANIIDPGKGSGWIGTPWHRDDAWTVVGAFAEIAKYPISRYSFLPAEEVERKRNSTTPYLFFANYELELRKDTSLLFGDPRYSKHGWDFQYKGAIAHLDAAFDGDNYNALTVMGPTYTVAGRQQYQGIGFTYQGNVKDWLKEIKRICALYRVKSLYIEKNADKGYTADKLREMGMKVVSYDESQNKHVKITTYLYEVWEDIEWSPDSDGQYMLQVVDYREGASPDDAPDSAASIFREGFKIQRSAAWALYQ